MSDPITAAIEADLKAKIEEATAKLESIQLAKVEAEAKLEADAKEAAALAIKVAKAAKADFLSRFGFFKRLVYRWFYDAFVELKKL